MSSSRSPEKPLVLDPDANHDVELITIDSVFLTLSLASVLARFASSKIKGAGYGLEEALLGLALVILPGPLTRQILKEIGYMC